MNPEPPEVVKRFLLRTVGERNRADGGDFDGKNSKKLLKVQKSLRGQPIALFV